MNCLSTMSSMNMRRPTNGPPALKTVENMFAGYTPSEGTTSLYTNDSTLSGTPYYVVSFTHQGYTVSASSCQRGSGLWNEYSSDFVYKMFDNNSDTFWNSGANNSTLTLQSPITNATLHSSSAVPAATTYTQTPYYNSIDPNAAYRGGNATNQYFRTAGNINGEWFQIQFPKKFQLKSFTSVNGNSPARMFYVIAVLASQDGVSWTLIDMAFNPSLTLQTWTHNMLPNDTFYLFFRFVVTNVTNRMANNTSPVDAFQGHAASSKFTMTGYNIVA